MCKKTAKVTPEMCKKLTKVTPEMCKTFIIFATSNTANYD